MRRCRSLAASDSSTHADKNVLLRGKSGGYFACWLVPGGAQPSRRVLPSGSVEQKLVRPNRLATAAGNTTPGHGTVTARCQRCHCRANSRAPRDLGRPPRMPRPKRAAPRATLFILVCSRSRNVLQVTLITVGTEACFSRDVTSSGRVPTSLTVRATSRTFCHCADVFYSAA